MDEDKDFMYDFSIVVCTHNSDIEKLLITLKSIVSQENVTYEIIIADDGSKFLDKCTIEDWFQENSFNDYFIVANSVNQGTVKNCISGVRLAKGKYIKTISPGDYLYNKDTLFKFKQFIDDNKYRVVFGKAAYYSVSNNDITLYQKMNPVDLQPYIDCDKNAIFKNYLYYRDYILGACLILEKEVFIKYLSIIQGKIKYAEDCSYILMVSDGVDIGFLDDFMIWYECDSGISTNKSSFWADMLYKDNLECFKLVVFRHPELRECYDLFIKRKNLRTILLWLQSKLHYKFLKFKSRYVGDKGFKHLDVNILKGILFGGSNASN